MSGNDHSQADRRTAYVLVAIQAVLIVGLVVFPAGSDWRVTDRVASIASTLTIIAAVLGLWAAAYLGRGLTPLPLPNGSTELVTSGPYRLVRHPIYTAVFIWAIGSTVGSGNYLKIIVLVLLISLFLYKSRWEEGQLATSFDGYAAYMERSGRFVPFVG
jgi:protein-S-isoprenylcysteine O-methyltransferase Ste14